MLTYSYWLPSTKRLGLGSGGVILATTVGGQCWVKQVSSKIARLMVASLACFTVEVR